MLQAWFDDSGRGKEADSPVFVLAGYAGRAENFHSFSEEWMTIMREAPALEYLKGKEANSLSGHFKGWTAEQRDTKLEHLIGAIRRHNLIAISVSINYRHFNRVLREPKGLFKNPYAIAFSHAVVWPLHSAHVKPVREEIELIFDQGVIERQKSIEDAYKGLKEALPLEVTNLLVGKPRFEDDRLHPPLQAADLFAWNVRRDYAEQLTTRKHWKSAAWTALRSEIKGKPLYMGEKELRAFKSRYSTAREERSARG